MHIYIYIYIYVYANIAACTSGTRCDDEPAHDIGGGERGHTRTHVHIYIYIYTHTHTRTPTYSTRARKS